MTLQQVLIRLLPSCKSSKAQIVPTTERTFSCLTSRFAEEQLLQARARTCAASFISRRARLHRACCGFKPPRYAQQVVVVPSPPLLQPQKMSCTLGTLTTRGNPLQIYCGNPGKKNRRFFMDLIDARQPRQPGGVVCATVWQCVPTVIILILDCCFHS